MNLLETLLSAGNGAAVQQLAGRLGVSGEEATSTMSALLPALATGVKERLAGGQASGLSDLITGGTLTKLADDPSLLAKPEATEQGKSLLTRVFGSQDLSSLVTMVAEKAGVNSNVVTSLLPIGAALLGGFLSKSSAAGENVEGLIGQIATAGHTGIVDTVKTLAAKFFG